MNHNNTRSHRLPDHNFNWGNGFFILPEEDKAVSALTSTGYPNNMPSSTTNFSSHSNSDMMNYRTSNLGVMRDPYLNYSSVTRPSLIPQIYSHSRSYYNQLDNRGSTGNGNGEADYERLYFKRKSSGYPMALDILDEYYNVGTSNGHSISSDQYTSKPNLGPHSWPRGSSSMLTAYLGNGQSTVGERYLSYRNVRSRHGDTHQLENNLVAPHASCSLPRHFHQITSTSGHSAMSCDSRRRFASPGFFHHEINLPIGSSGANTMMEIADRYSSNPVTSRNTATTVPTLPGFPMQDDINYVQRLNPPYNSSRHTAMEDIRQFDNEVVPHARHLRLGQTGERHGRTRSLYDSLSYRMSTLVDEEHARARLNNEDTVMIDRSVFYDPPALFDQHRSMRMDVDNMTYEELLALGERIGTVSTGLSEEDVERCLTRNIFAVDRNTDGEEGSCAICLEEYKSGQSTGRLNCGHDFHAVCIKKWLLIKNACPICKSVALGDKVKGKQVLLM